MDEGGKPDLPVARSFWFGNPITWIGFLSMQSYLSQGHSFELYAYEDISVPEGVSLKDANELIPESESFEMLNSIDGIRGRFTTFSNVFRYKLIHDKGGMWVDLDSICVKSIDINHPTGLLFASERARTGLEINNCNIWVSDPGHPVLAALYSKAMSADQSSLHHLSFNKKFILDVFDVMGYDWTLYVAPVEWFCPIPWYNIQTIFSSSSDEPARSLCNQSYAIHLFNNVIEADHRDLLHRPMKSRSLISDLVDFINQRSTEIQNQQKINYG